MNTRNNDKTSDDNKSSDVEETTLKGSPEQKSDSAKTASAAAKQASKAAEKVTQERAQKKPGASAAKKSRSSQAKSPATEKKRGSAAGLFIAVLAVLLALAAVAGIYYLYKQEQVQNAVLADRFVALQSGIDSNQQKLTELSRLDTLKQEIDAVRAEIGNVTNVSQRIEAEQQALNTTLAAMTTKLGRTTVAWRLAEIEYLLIIANNRLRLEQDRNTALVALQTADQKLRAVGDPAFVPVRQSIASEVTGLKAVQAPDITGMALSLGSLARAVDELPLLDTQPVLASGPADESSKVEYQSLGWADIPAAMWNDIRSLVVVRRVDRPIEPLLPPAQEWYLRQNLQLKLEQARLALLRHETTLFRHQLDEAAEWISAYFDVESGAVASLLDDLEALKKKELQPTMPDISTSLRLLREQMKGLGEEVEAAQREDSEQ